MYHRRGIGCRTHTPLAIMCVAKFSCIAICNSVDFQDVGLLMYMYIGHYTAAECILRPVANKVIFYLGYL